LKDYLEVRFGDSGKIIFKGGVVDVLEVFALIQLNAWFGVASKVLSTCFYHYDRCLDPLMCMYLI